MAQNNHLLTERYEVINSLYKNGTITLDKHFFQFMGLGALISSPKLIDNLLGHCMDEETKKLYSFSDLFSQDDIEEIYDQIDQFSHYRTIDSNFLSKNIKISNDRNNTKTAITLPIIYHDKAIVYETNKKDSERLLVLVKKNKEWLIICEKLLYLRFDD